MRQGLCEWGFAGLQALRGRVEVLIVVDVLSFSTAVEIAVSQGATVIPFPPGDRHTAAEAANRVGGLLAAQRGAASGGFSLSPASLLTIPKGTRLVLPSPNGSRLSLIGGGVPVLAGCLRNAGTVAGLALSLAGSGSVGVVMAGERWSDGSLRPAVEDLIGAGAILDGLNLPLSAEARVARDAFRSAESDLPALLRDTVSGRELIERGYAKDVELAVEFDVSMVAPVLRNGAFIAG